MAPLYPLKMAALILIRPPCLLCFTALFSRGGMPFWPALARSRLLSPAQCKLRHSLRLPRPTDGKVMPGQDMRSLKIQCLWSSHLLSRRPLLHGPYVMGVYLYPKPGEPGKPAVFVCDIMQCQVG
jgi:hypothetical protein